VLTESSLSLCITEEKPYSLVSAVVGLVLLNPRCNGCAVDVHLVLCLGIRVQ